MRKLGALFLEESSANFSIGFAILTFSDQLSLANGFAYPLRSEMFTLAASLKANVTLACQLHLTIM